MIGPVLQFDDLKRISGYTRAADVERWAKRIGLATKPTQDGPASSVQAWNVALGITPAPNDPYQPDAVV